MLPPGEGADDRGSLHVGPGSILSQNGQFQKARELLAKSGA